MGNFDDKTKAIHQEDAQESNAIFRDLDSENAVQDKSEINSPEIDSQDTPSENEIAERRGNTRREITSAQEKQEQKNVSPKEKKRLAKRNQNVKLKKRKVKLKAKILIVALASALKKKALAQARQALKKNGNKKPTPKKSTNSEKNQKSERPKKSDKRPKQKLKTLKREYIAPIETKVENFHGEIDGKQVSGKIITQEYDKHPLNEKPQDKKNEKPLDKLFKDKSPEQEIMSEDIKVEEVDNSFDVEKFGTITPDSVRDILSKDLNKAAEIEK